MATVALNPNAEGTTIQWTPLSGTDNALMVDEGVDAHDSDTSYVSVAAAATNKVDFYELDDVPGDFSANESYLVRLIIKQSGRVDDDVTVVGIVSESDESTLLAAGSAGVLLTSTTYVLLESDEGAVADTADDATWNSRKFRLLTSKAASGMADAVTVFCTAAEVFLTYTASGPATTQPIWRRTGGVPGMRRMGGIFGRTW